MKKKKRFMERRSALHWKVCALKNTRTKAVFFTLTLEAPTFFYLIITVISSIGLQYRYIGDYYGHFFYLKVAKQIEKLFSRSSFYEHQKYIYSSLPLPSVFVK